ncbi:MAG: hypothetical protein LBR32_02030, partial [Propionibacteriaceae bacterium]|nr:hypothetical protein [Propionibacteriaceae bacterium]
MTDHTSPWEPLFVGDMLHGAVASRRLLVRAVKALEEFKDAVTVIGAHAVHVWVEQAWGPISMEATRDADIALNPLFVTDNPKLADLMAGAGIAPALADRPGIYGLADEAELEWSRRTTVDLIVPEVYAGSGRRAARLPGQRHAASRAVGLELAIWDRAVTKLSTLDPPHESVDAYVAGPAALLTAKAHKVHERLAGAVRRPDRLRAKDSGDVALLMLVSDPTDVGRTMVNASAAHPEVLTVVAAAASWLRELYGPSGGMPRQHATSA